MDFILSELKRRLDNNCIKLPSTINFKYNETDKCIHMKMSSGIKENMQSNSAAFEGWALALKGNLPDLVDCIKLSWDEEEQPKSKTSKGWRHFNRFLYRVEGFKNRYTWFYVDNDLTWDVQRKNWNTLVLNSPGKRNDENLFGNFNFDSEHAMELYFTSNNKLVNAVFEKFDTEIDQIENQFPVGVFDSNVNSNSFVFTGGKSAIDLYGRGKDGSFNIFELKAEGNVQVGIVSELFFYALLIRDTIDGNIISEGNDFKDINKLNAYFLVTRLHPLITKEVINMLNIESDKIEFRKLIYSIRDVNFE